MLEYFFDLVYWDNSDPLNEQLAAKRLRIHSVKQLHPSTYAKVFTAGLARGINLSGGYAPQKAVKGVHYSGKVESFRFKGDEMIIVVSFPVTILSKGERG